MNRRTILSLAAGLVAILPFRTTKTRRSVTQPKMKTWGGEDGDFERIFYEGQILLPEHGNHRYRLEWDADRNYMVIQSMCTPEMRYPFDSPRGQFVAPYIELSEWRNTAYGREVISRYPAEIYLYT